MSNPFNLTNTTAEQVNHYGNLSINQSGVSVDKFSSLVGEAVGPLGFGTRNFTGLGLIAMTAYVLYRQEAGISTSTAVMVPTTFILARFGFLPNGKALIYSIVLGVAVAITAGSNRYL